MCVCCMRVCVCTHIFFNQKSSHAVTEGSPLSEVWGNKDLYLYPRGLVANSSDQPERDWSGQGLFSHLHKGLQNIPKVAFRVIPMHMKGSQRREGGMPKLRYSGSVMAPSERI